MFQASLYFYPHKYLGHFMCMIYRYPQHTTRHAPDYNVISDLYLQVIHLAKTYNYYNNPLLIILYGSFRLHHVGDMRLELILVFMITHYYCTLFLGLYNNKYWPQTMIN